MFIKTLDEKKTAPKNTKIYQKKFFSASSSPSSVLSPLGPYLVKSSVYIVARELWLCRIPTVKKTAFFF
jgi:hypothetical protein